MSTLAAGFARPVFDSQAAFRAAMDALSRPGTPTALCSDLSPPAPLTPAAAAIALSLLDFEVSFWLAPSLSAGDVGAYLRFHTGAREVDAANEADFVLIDLAQDNLDLSAFKPGEAAYPDRSATVLALVESVEAETGPVLTGPGIKVRATLSATPLPAGFAGQWAANAAAYPLGVDVIFAAPEAVLGLPRSTRLIEEVR
jgi:alpha-D-ribose 1-methylphosphonate 5-triphosphate synthase subunit PhnH